MNPSEDDLKRAVNGQYVKQGVGIVDYLAIGSMALCGNRHKVAEFRKLRQGAT
ncbi:CGNR zinc finger domain-containing protein [Pseudomonas umsongensis]|uniref:CGNR zinc finger domain-containing protein n=1 Tax=Pseudomonas umsongensis TaxID=198618 RepID=UPI0015BCD0EE|nr:CGNR zinc finger domain-containing protein [Pseudomonas umsongensis]